MKCSQIKPNGVQCGANATKDSTLCFTHNPAYQDRKREAVTKGGLNRKNYGVYGNPVEVRNSEDLKKVISQTINGIVTGKIPSNQPATQIGFLARCWLEADAKSEENVRLDSFGFSFGKKDT